MLLAMVRVEDHEQRGAVRGHNGADMAHDLGRRAVADDEADPRMALDRVVRYADIDADHQPLGVAGREQIREAERGAAVTGSRLDHPLQAARDDDLLVVPHVRGILQRAHPAVVQVLPHAGVVVPAQVPKPGVVTHAAIGCAGPRRFPVSHGFSPTTRMSRGSRNLNSAGSWRTLTSPASSMTRARLLGV